MRLVYKFYIPHTEELDHLFRTANNLYNQALYIFRQRLEKDGVWLSWCDIDKLIKDVPNLEGGYNYRMVPSVVAQQVLRFLGMNIRSYCRCIKDWKKHPEKYNGMPQLPRYRKRGSMMTITYPRLGTKIVDGCIKLSRGPKIIVPQWEKYGDALQSWQQLCLVPGRNTIKVVIYYECDTVQSDVDKSKCAAIDLGVDNLVTMVTDECCTIFSGKYLKSYNQFFNKMLAKLYSINSKQGDMKCTKRIAKMYEKRDRYFDDAFNKVSRQIVDMLVEKKIGRLVVGHNHGWKQRCSSSKVNNQKFQSIPFARLIFCLKYKCEQVGIDFVEHEEGYTSKCDALALEPIGKHDEYLGYRIKRGLFVSSTGKLINADQNGALNIMRKVVGDSYVSGIVSSGHSLCPVRYSNPFTRNV